MLVDEGSRGAARAAPLLLSSGAALSDVVARLLLGCVGAPPPWGRSTGVTVYVNV
jgi:hypothetical protein